MADFSPGIAQTGNLAGDVAAIQRIAAVPSILEVVCNITGMRLAAIARVTEDEWVACAVRDEMGYGLLPGTELDLKSTLCDEVRGHRGAILIEHAAEDPIFRDHQTPSLYGFQSYISSPIVRTNGEFFGTIFAIDTAPAKLSNSGALTGLPLFAQLIALELDAGGRQIGAS
jgi:GAF domain-containing protein